MRTFFAILVGFILSTLGIIGSEVLLTKFFARGGGGVAIIPEAQIIALQIGISVIHGLIGGWITSLLARTEVWAAGGGLAAARLLAFAASYPNVRGKQPEWYLLTLLLIGIGTAFLAAWLRSMQLKRRAAREAASGEAGADQLRTA